MFKSLTETRFFKMLKKQAERENKKTYWGRIGMKLVESNRRIIVYDTRGVLHASDNVEEATSFFCQEKATGRFVGDMYLHSGSKWVPVSDAKE